MSLTVNKVGGVLAALALVAVIVFGASRSAILAGFLAGSVSAQAPAKPAEVVKPAPLMAGHLAGCTVAKPCPVVKPVRTYRKVLTNGKIDGRIGCRYVPKIVNEFDRAQILAGAAQYGLSPQQLSALRVCLN